MSRTVLYCTVLYCTVLYCTVLHCNGLGAEAGSCGRCCFVILVVTCRSYDVVTIIKLVKLVASTRCTIVICYSQVNSPKRVEVYGDDASSKNQTFTPPLTLLAHFSVATRFAVQTISPIMGRVTSLTVDQCEVKPSTVQFVVNSCPQLSSLVFCAHNGALEHPQVIHCPGLRDPLEREPLDAGYGSTHFFLRL